MLTLQDVLFALGFAITATFTWLTYRSNNRKNQAAIDEDRKRTEILMAAYHRGDVNNIAEASRIVKSLDSEMRTPDPEPPESV
ncbi:hypothetical protein [Pantoea phage PA-1]